ncbi:MAG: hypothetical protein O8C61_03100 [Candidatus Methanoperedens sp.]|nr:hypothetical protein [Candidatus Methanoperedens sp.]
MSAYKTKDMGSALKKKGFKFHQSHHTFYVFYFNGKKTNIKTFISHGEKEYGDTLISAMKKQLHLSREEFDNLISCPLKEEKLIEIYLKQGLIE